MNIVAFLASFILGVYLLYKSFVQHVDIACFRDSGSLRTRIKNSAFFALGGSLLLTSLFILLTILDPSYQWTSKLVLGISIISITFSVVLFLGSLYRLFITVKLRDFVAKRYGVKSHFKER